jgi:hypothetical protein
MAVVALSPAAASAALARRATPVTVSLAGGFRKTRAGDVDRRARVVGDRNIERAADHRGGAF